MTKAELMQCVPRRPIKVFKDSYEYTLKIDECEIAKTKFKWVADYIVGCHDLLPELSKRKSRRKCNDAT
jgi:hypothetical protein